jgi:cysteinyl-tRNA synthetase
MDFCLKSYSRATSVLDKAYSPMAVRFFMLQTHYRSTLDFSNEALQASEKGLKRLWEAYEALKKLEAGVGSWQEMQSWIKDTVPDRRI